MMDSRGTALVLGGLGFIGSHMAARLAGAGWNVRVVDRADTEDREAQSRLRSLPIDVAVGHGEIQDADAMTPLLDSVDVVFDLAGSTGHLTSMADPVSDIRDNLVSHVQFIGLLKKRCPDTTVILASTRQVLGASSGLPVDDSACARPVDVNGVSKLALEQFLRVNGTAWGMRSCTLRLPNVYGPRMRTRDASNGVIGGWAGQAQRGDDLRVYGSGLGQRNVLYIDDAVDALLAAVPTASAESPVFLVGGEERTLASIAEGIASRTGVSVSHTQMPADQEAIDIGSVIVDDSRFRQMTGWRPEVGFDEGLERTLHFMSSQDAHHG
jgi:nucleoside-diphosphate-sugar epimerase